MDGYRFRIYYGDGSTFSERDGSPFDAPSANVQVVAVQSGNEKGFDLWHFKEGYYWNPDFGWIGCDMAGMWDYLLMFKGPKAILFGRSLRDAEFWKIVERAGVEGLGD